MRTRIIEVTNGPQNFGKFLVGRFSPPDWSRTSRVTEEFDGSRRSLLGVCGWTPNHVLVFDLQTGEGGLFLPGGNPIIDLDKRRIWVCPLFEPFLSWVYITITPETNILELPDRLDLPDVPFQWSGYRRPGESR